MSKELELIAEVKADLNRSIFKLNTVQDSINRAAIALLMWGGKVLVISTHLGEENAFAKLIEDARAGRNPYHVEKYDFDAALQDGQQRRTAVAHPVVERRADGIVVAGHLDEVRQDVAAGRGHAHRQLVQVFITAMVTGMTDALSDDQDVHGKAVDAVRAILAGDLVQPPKAAARRRRAG